MNEFDRVYKQMFEMVSSDAWGTADVGTHGGDFGNVDFYAQGDVRIAKPLGAKRRKCKKNGKCKQNIVIQRRPKPSEM